MAQQELSERVISLLEARRYDELGVEDWIFAVFSLAVEDFVNDLAQNQKPVPEWVTRTPPVGVAAALHLSETKQFSELSLAVPVLSQMPPPAKQTLKQALARIVEDARHLTSSDERYAPTRPALRGAQFLNLNVC